MFGRTRERVMNGSLGPAVLAKPTILRPREHLTLTRRAGIEKRRVYEEVLVEDAYTRKQVTPSTRVYPPAPNHAPEQHLSANRTFRQLSHFFFSCFLDRLFKRCAAYRMLCFVRVFTTLLWRTLAELACAQTAFPQEHCLELARGALASVATTTSVARRMLRLALSLLYPSATLDWVDESCKSASTAGLNRYRHVALLPPLALLSGIGPPLCPWRPDSSCYIFLFSSQ